MGMTKDPQTYQIIGAAMEVHKNLGKGFLEHVYHEALSIELNTAHIPFEHEVMLSIYYKNQLLVKKYYADFICFQNIIVELKAVNKLEQAHTAQTLNYLKATKFKKGLILNFGAKSLEYKRVIL